jgi:hypothetical protein
MRGHGCMNLRTGACVFLTYTHNHTHSHGGVCVFSLTYTHSLTHSHTYHHTRFSWYSSAAMDEFGVTHSHTQTPHTEMHPHTHICIYSGQNYIYVIYRFFWQGNHLVYGPIKCISTVLANPTQIHTHTPRTPIFCKHTQGFQWGAREGPLCDEPMRNVKFKVGVRANASCKP